MDAPESQPAAWLALLGQCAASAFWAAATVAAGRYEPSDVLQLLAALSWLGACAAQGVALLPLQR